MNNMFMLEINICESVCVATGQTTATLASFGQRRDGKAARTSFLVQQDVKNEQRSREVSLNATDR